MRIADVHAGQKAWQAQRKRLAALREFQHPVAQARQTFFDIAAQRQKIQTQLMPAQISELLNQQALPSRIGFPVQPSTVVARLVAAQPLVVITPAP